MSKNIVLCLDGTDNRVRPGRSTNVLELFRTLDLSDPASQVGYYDPGLGTFSSPAAWTPAAQIASRWAGKVAGAGIRQNLAEVYGFLISVYEEGDSIFAFGFSRGAYTARALAGMLELIGILRRGADNLIPYVIGDYARPDKDRDGKLEKYWETLREDSKIFGHRVGSRLNRTSHAPVDFLGLWDTVRAVGTLRGPLYWPYTSQLPHARTVRHALAIDEWRRPFHPLMVKPTDPDHLIHTEQRIEQVWFAGVHSDIGGGLAAGRDGTRLSRVALKWMLDEAIKAGVKVVPSRYTKAAAVSIEDANSPIHQYSSAWRLLGSGRRSVPENARVHASVLQRSDYETAYRPKLPQAYAVHDENWQEPIAIPNPPDNLTPN